MVITLDLSSALTLTDAEFAAICRRNRDLRLEKTATGELVVMPPTGGDTGERIDPETRTVEIYQPDSPYQILTRPQSLSADPVLPGFSLSLEDIFLP